MKGRRRVLVRAVFVLAPLYVLLQHVVTEHIGEPYPAIAMPAFGGKVLDSHGVQHVLTPRMTVAFTDGTHVRLDQGVLFADARTLRTALAKRMFLPGHGRPLTQDPGFLSWLRGRLAAIYPGRTANSLSVRWIVARYALPGGYLGDNPTPVSQVMVRLR